MNSNNYRARLLAGASVAVIASTLGMGMSVAFAQSVAVTAITASSVIPPAADLYLAKVVTGIAVQSTNQYLVPPAAIAATVNTGVIASAFGSANTPTAIYNNFIEAIGVGNSAVLTDPTPPPAFPNGTVNGPASFFVNQVDNSVPVTATVTASTFDASNPAGFTNTSIIVGPNGGSPGNTISAQVILNKAVDQYGGTLSNTFGTSETAGSVLLNTDPSLSGTTIVTSSGNLNLLTSQYNTLSEQGAGSEALLSGNSVSAEVDTADTSYELITGVVTINGNTLSATYQGNYSDAALTALGGQLASYTGSLTLGTVQVNGPDTPPGGTLAASNTGSTVSANLLGETVPTPTTNTLAGPLTVSNNTISSSATGNAAYTPTSSTTATGNVITFGGMSIDDTASLLSTGVVNSVSYPGTGGTLITVLQADISLANIQANLGAPLSASTTDGLVTVSVQDMSVGGGSVAVGGNAITATVNGNEAYNLITGSSLSSITATIGLQNVQTNDSSNFAASGSGNAITVAIATGSYGGTLNGDNTIEVGAQVTSTIAGSVGSTGNLIGVSAFGNQAGNYVLLTSDTLQDTIQRGPPTDTAGNGLALAGNRVFNTVSAQARNGLFPGAAIINVQSNLDGSSITATNTGPSITLTVGSTTNSSATYPLLSSGDVNGVSGSTTLGVDNNTLQAVAEGNFAVSEFSLTVTNAFTGNAGIASVQTQDGTVTSTLTDAQVALSVIPNFDAGTVTVTHNTLMAESQGNYAENLIYASAGSILNNNGGGIISHYSPGTLPLDQGGSVVFGVFPILNDQVVTADISASNTATTPISLSFGGNFAGTAHNDLNYFAAQAVGNQAINMVTMPAVGGTLLSDLNSFSTFGAVQNLQTVGDGLTISSNAAATGPGIVTSIVGSSSGTVTLSNNVLLASAVGNEAGNTVQATGANSIDWNTTFNIGLPLVQQIAGVTDYDFGMFVISNMQYTGLSTITASLSSGSVLALLGTQNTHGTRITGTVTLDGNVLQATAYDNFAGNLISLSATASLTTTGDVQSQQVSLSDTVATAGSLFDPLIVGIGLSSHDSAAFGALSVTNSTIGATAYANSVNNAIILSAGDSADSQFPLLTEPFQGVQGYSAQTSYNGLMSGYVGGDYGIANLQISTGDTSATVFGLAGITLDGAHLYREAATVSLNKIEADAEANFAANSVSLTIANGNSSNSSGSPTIAVGNWQLTNGDGQTISASATGGFGIGQPFGFGGNVANSVLGVSGNAVNAIGMANSATNSITVTASNNLGSTYGTPATASYELGAGGDPTLSSFGSVADYAVSNMQNNLSADVSATATAGSLFLPSGIDLLGYNIYESVLTVSDNRVLAQAGSNTATNSLTISAAAVAATGSVLNVQGNDGTATARAGGVVGIVVGGFGRADTSRSVLSVTGNSINAVAWGNNAGNYLTASSTTGFPSSAAPTYSVGGPIAGGLDSVTANQVVLNEQLNNGAISATAGGLLGVVTLNDVRNSVISVSGNTVAATAYGNNADNEMVLNGNNASGEVGNGQVNTGPISATVGPITAIGVASIGSISNTPINVSDNTIAALATGNAANSSLVLNGASTTGGIVSTQTNSGAVTATISGAVIGVLATGPITGGSATVSGNQVLAMAVGNSVTNTVTKH